MVAVIKTGKGKLLGKKTHPYSARAGLSLGVLELIGKKKIRGGDHLSLRRVPEANYGKESMLKSKKSDEKVGGITGREGSVGGRGKRRGLLQPLCRPGKIGRKGLQEGGEGPQRKLSKQGTTGGSLAVVRRSLQEGSSIEGRRGR